MSDKKPLDYLLTDFNPRDHFSEGLLNVMDNSKAAVDKLKKPTNDVEEVHFLLDKVEIMDGELRHSSLRVRAKDVYDEAIELSKKIGDKNLLNEVYDRIINFFTEKNARSHVAHYSIQSGRIDLTNEMISSLGNPNNQNYDFYEAAHFCTEMGDLKRATEYKKLYLEELLENKEFRHAAEIASGLGLNDLATGLLEKAILEYEKSKGFQQGDKDSLHHYAWLQKKVGNVDKAYEFFIKSEYFSSAAEIARENNDEVGFNNAVDLQTEKYLNNNQFKLAISHALEHGRKEDAKFFYSRSYQNFDEQVEKLERTNNLDFDVLLNLISEITESAELINDDSPNYHFWKISNFHLPLINAGLNTNVEDSISLNAKIANSAYGLIEEKINGRKGYELGLTIAEKTRNQEKIQFYNSKL